MLPALLLASTLGEHNPSLHSGQMAAMLGTTTFSWDRLRQLDMRQHLQSDSVYLIGFAEDPGPVRLAARRSGSYKTIYPQKNRSWTMYRIRIPIGHTVESEAPAPSEAEAGQAEAGD